MRELSRGFVFAVLALLTVLAGLALAVSENSVHPATVTPASTSALTETLFVPSPVIPTAATVDALALLLTPGPVVSPTSCPIPAGWIRVTLTRDDTLLGLAAQRGIGLPTLLQVNCLSNDSTFVGEVVYVPAVTPTSAPTESCGPPPSWVFYAVQPGDTLAALSRRYAVSIYDLRQANCLPGVSITVGQKLFVPPNSAGPTTSTPIDTTQPLASTAPTTQTVVTPTASGTTTAMLTVEPLATHTQTATLTPTPTSTATAPASATTFASATTTLTATTAAPATDTTTPADTATAADTPMPTPTGTVGP